jgi:hypothetical protein
MAHQLRKARARTSLMAGVKNSARRSSGFTDTETPPYHHAVLALLYLASPGAEKPPAVTLPARGFRKGCER